jgi:hypothetical protein
MSADGSRFRLEVGQELQNVKVEAGPDRFAVLFAADDLLNGGIGPNLPKLIVLVGLGIAEANLHGGRMPFPALGDLILKCLKPFFGHGFTRELRRAGDSAGELLGRYIY